jgi:hypothetical protein
MFFKQGPLRRRLTSVKAGDLVQRGELDGLADDMKADRPRTGDDPDDGREEEPLSGRPQFEALQSGKEVVHRGRIQPEVPRQRGPRRIAEAFILPHHFQGAELVRLTAVGWAAELQVDPGD